MKKVILILVVCLSFQSAFATDSDSTRDIFGFKKKSNSSQAGNYFWSNSKEICFNVNTLISQVVPFNLKEVDNGFSSIKTKWYGRKNAFRTEIGLNINEESSLVYIGIGGEKRRNLHKHFHYTTGSDAFFLADNRDRNGIGNSIIMLGLTKFYGLEYHINNKFFVGTEAKLSIGLGNDIRFQFLPPVAIFAGLRL